MPALVPRIRTRESNCRDSCCQAYDVLTGQQVHAMDDQLA